MRTCERCSREMPHKNAHARFCSDKCRNYARREAARIVIPKELSKLDRWVRWRYVERNGRQTKVPLTVGGRAASSTDPSTWSSFRSAKESDVGAGLGFVLNGDGICCVDLDHVITDGVLDEKARVFLDGLDAFHVETSPSGTGVHAWVRTGSPSGRKVYTTEDGLKVEWYADGRYLTMTGKVLKW